MAIGPLARVLVQAAVMGISIIARALPAAYGAALQNARKSGMDATKAKAESSGGLFSSKRMAVDEALMVLNLTDMKSSNGEMDPVLVQKQYEKYFEANAVTDKGGSFYIQSKIYRAKESLDEFIKEKRIEEQKQRQQQQDQGKSQ